MSETDPTEILNAEENVLVTGFPPDTDVKRATFAEVHERFVSLVQPPSVDTHVTMLHTESPMGSDVFEQGREGQRSAQCTA